jgi:hypothetical protein
MTGNERLRKRGAIAGAALVVLILAGMMMAPASAGTKYMAGSPELSAAVAGMNEFSPGGEAVISIRLQNEGLNEFKFVQSGIVDREDLPNTAKMVIVDLGPGDSPVIIKSDPQMIGDLRGGTSTLVNFNVKIPRNATAGTYELPLNVQYTYLWNAEQYGTDSIQYLYREKNETLSVPVRIKPELQFSVISSESGNLNAGMEGYVHLTIMNTGQEEGKNAILKISRNGNSLVIPTDSSTYIGDFPARATFPASFKVSVSEDAVNKSYPLDVSINYENGEGDVVDTDLVTIGVPVGNKVGFSVGGDPVRITPGEKKVITVVYTNTGDVAVESAQARISVVDPFTSSDDTAFLGTVAPGESKEGSFEIAVDGSATEKEYGLDSEVRFRDAIGNSIISDPVKVPIIVERNTGVGAVLGSPLVLGVIAVGVIGGGYLVWRKRKKQ